MASRPITDFDRAISAYIRAEAAKKKVGQDEVARRAGLHINTFRHYWRGERSVGLSDLRDIMEAIGVPLDTDEIERIYQSGNYTP